MALARTWAVALSGIAGHLVAVEADLAAGLPGTTVIGMGDAAVTQARDRVRAAVLNSGQKWPDRRITLALSPAALPKRGAGYDIALAVAVLAAAGSVPAGGAGEAVLVGELGLDGTVRPVRGVLPSLLAARAAGRVRAVVPAGNVAEAALATGVRVHGVRCLADLIAWLRGERNDLVAAVPASPGDDRVVPDLADVLGQPEARLALEVAAAGGHHLAMIGPPGAGKTMLATRLPGVLPPLEPEQALEVTAVHSVAGTLARGHPADHPAAVRRPAPLRVAGRGGRRRIGAHPARQRQPRPPRRAVPRRGPGVPPDGVGCAAAADGVGNGVAGQGFWGGALSGAVSVDPGGESVSVRGGEGRGLHAARPACGAGTWVGCRGR